MNRISRLLVGVSLFLAGGSVAAFAQGGANLSNVAGVKVASQYNWERTAARIYSGTAAGSGTITLYAPYVVLKDGKQLIPWSTSAPIIVDMGTSVQETVTPTAVSGCTFNASIGSCSITATFSNAHGEGGSVVSGTGGLYEAVLDAAVTGGVVVNDIGSTATAAQVTAARALAANVGIIDEKTSANGIPVASTLLVGVGTGTASSSATLYLAAPGSSTNALTNTTATNATYVAPRTGTLRNLSCTSTTGGVNGNSGVVTVRTAALSTGTFSSSGITGTFGTSTAASDSTHTASVTLGQPMQLQVTTQASETLAGVVCTVQLN